MEAFESLDNKWVVIGVFGPDFDDLCPLALDVLEEGLIEVLEASEVLFGDLLLHLTSALLDPFVELFWLHLEVD